MVHRLKSDIPGIGAHPTQHIQEVRDKRLDLSKVIGLLEDPLTTNLKEKHLFVLRKLLNRNPAGFLLKELTDISRILSLCAEKATDHPEYASFLCEALKICRLPFLQQKTTDEQHFAQEAAEFLSSICYLMRIPDPDVRRCVVEAVQSFFCSGIPPKPPDGLRPTRPGYRQQLLKHSDVPKLLLLSMSGLEDQPFKLQLLQTLQILSRSSDDICASVLDERGAESICLHMNEPDPSAQVLLCSSEILWNLLEGGMKEEVIAQLSSLECVLSLKESFLFLLEKASQRWERQLRNQLLMIATLIAEASSSVLVESLFAKLLVGLLTFPERNPPYSSDGLQLRQLLLNLLVFLCRDPAALQILREEQVMLHLLSLANPDGDQERSSAQQEELQLQALGAVSCLAPLLLDDYVFCRGNTQLLLLLDRCVGTGDCFSQGFHGNGGGRTRAKLRGCIRALRAVTSLGEASVNQNLCEQRAFHQLLGVLIQLQAGCEEQDVVVVEMMSDIQWILSELCESDARAKEQFGSGGVEMVVNFLKRGSEKFYSGLGHNRLLLSTVDCVWSCVVGSDATEDYLLAKQGASLLLDLLRASPRCVHGVVLATLLDLCDNPNTRSQILSWRDTDGQTAPRILLELWRDEEEELGVLRDQHGRIKDPKKPILTHLQQEVSGGSSFPADSPSAAVLEVSENLRAKIYLIFCCLGFQELPGLSAEDFFTLSIVRRYLNFKVGEVWDEVSRELVLEGTRLTSSDEEALRSICETSEETARRVMEEQSDILEQQQSVELHEEMVAYAEMKSHWKQQELTAQSWKNYVSRTSAYSVLKEVKVQRKEQVEWSRPTPEDGGAAGPPAEDFITHFLSAENGDILGLRGLNVKMARTSIRPDQNQESRTESD
ncbi:transcript variant X2 [Nothobranchius furzeri]|uniref:Transcript variant X2 n=1 Tax=Nothobranchius furzeri TaxID=105023 RepID=A0A9D2XZJ0_NOTFU|nr:transcript variant X2 [Nothobranchius furzeri]